MDERWSRSDKLNLAWIIVTVFTVLLSVVFAKWMDDHPSLGAAMLTAAQVVWFSLAVAQVAVGIALVYCHRKDRTAVNAEVAKATARADNAERLSTALQQKWSDLETNFLSYGWLLHAACREQVSTVWLDGRYEIYVEVENMSPFNYEVGALIAGSIRIGGVDMPEHRFTVLGGQEGELLRPGRKFDAVIRGILPKAEIEKWGGARYAQVGIVGLKVAFLRDAKAVCNAPVHYVQSAIEVKV